MEIMKRMEQRSSPTTRRVPPPPTIISMEKGELKALDTLMKLVCNLSCLKFVYTTPTAHILRYRAFTLCADLVARYHFDLGLVGLRWPVPR